MTAETQLHEVCVGIVLHPLFVSLTQRDIADCLSIWARQETLPLGLSHRCYCFNSPPSCADCGVPHSFEDFVFSETTPFAAYRKSSSLVRGLNRCGGFCACVAGLFNVSDSFFSGGQPFSSADSSLFMGLRSLQKHGW